MAGSSEIHRAGGCADYYVLRLVICGRVGDAAAEHSATVAFNPAADDRLDFSWVERVVQYSGENHFFCDVSDICCRCFRSNVSVTRRLGLERPPCEGDFSARDDDDCTVKL